MSTPNSKVEASSLHASTPKVDFSKPIDLDHVKGKTALVQGGVSGIGLGISRALCKVGAFVVIADINTSAGECVEQEFLANRYQAKYIETDVTSWDSQQAAFKQAIEYSPTKSLDIVILCAGVIGTPLHQAMSRMTADNDLAAPDTRAIDVNLKGTYFATLLSLHYFKQTEQPDTGRAEDKHLLLFASLAAYAPMHLCTEYMASICGVRGIFKSLRPCRSDIAGVRVNLIAPAAVKTPMTEGFAPMLDELGYVWADVEDVVQAALRLCCDTSAYGRAVCAAPGTLVDGPGTANFDLCDDYKGFDGGREVLDAIEKGKFGDAYLPAAAVMVGKD